MLSSSIIRKNGILVRTQEIPDSLKFGLKTKQIISPLMGSALTSCQVIYQKPGEMYPVHFHPISEDVVIVYKGRGEAFLGNSWYEVEEGDIIYAPEYVKHGTRNPPLNASELICYNWQVPYLEDTKSLEGAKDEVFIDQYGKVVTLEERGKFDVHIPGTGFIGHMDSGALFVEYGAPMRFIIWPGMGSRKISLHRALHPPGFEFHVHAHPDSEDTILAFRGNGQGYLVDHWIDMNEGDVLHAPKGVKHGTRNNKSSGEPFVCTGAAAPPQADLYKKAGYL
jgi:quercetin dioxygenase-like cupin family protein